MIIRLSRISTGSFEVFVDGNHIFYAETKDFPSLLKKLHFSSLSSTPMNYPETKAFSRAGAVVHRHKSRIKARQRLRFYHKVNSRVQCQVELLFDPAEFTLW